SRQLLEAILRKMEEYDKQTGEVKTLHRLVRIIAANQLGVLHAGFGEHEEAVQCFTSAITQAESVGDQETADRFRGNLAVSLEALGRMDEAAQAYRDLVASYRREGDPALLAFGLGSLASHLIRQYQL